MAPYGLTSALVFNLLPITGKLAYDETIKWTSGCLESEITSKKWTTSNLIPTEMYRNVFFWTYTMVFLNKWISWHLHSTLFIRKHSTISEMKSDLKSSHSKLNFLSNDLGRENKRCSCVQKDEFCNVIKRWIWRNLPKEIISFCNMLLLLFFSLPSWFCHSQFVSEVLRCGTAVLRCTDAFIRNTCWAQCFPLDPANNAAASAAEASPSAEIRDRPTVFVWSIQHIFLWQCQQEPHKHLNVIKDDNKMEFYVSLTLWITFSRLKWLF